MEFDALQDRRLALLGLGVENQALGRWLASRGLGFAVCDADPARRLDGAPWKEAVRDWRLGPGCFDRLHDFDLIFRSPGIPSLRPELEQARRRGTEVSSQTALFLERCPAPVVGITGTKGKGTTASLLDSILRREPGLSPHLGGNIGIPPVSFLDDLSAADVVVLELSSFQLQDLDRSPHGAVILPVTLDHLDYHASRAEYVEAKAAICRCQDRGDWVVSNAGDATAGELAARSPGRSLGFRAAPPLEGDGCWSEGGEIRWREDGRVESLAAVSDLRLRGTHNLANACAAAGAARLCGASAAAVGQGLSAVESLPHRLEEVAERGGVLFVNDSLATTPEAAAAGLAAYAGRPVVLIAGGASKGGTFEGLGTAIARSAAALVTLGEEGPAIAAAARAAGFRGPAAADCPSMEAAVRRAAGLAPAGGVVLLSPGCASFGMFSDYAARGEAFRTAIG